MESYVHFEVSSLLENVQCSHVGHLYVTVDRSTGAKGLSFLISEFQPIISPLSCLWAMVRRSIPTQECDGAKRQKREREQDSLQVTLHNLLPPVRTKQ